MEQKHRSISLADQVFEKLETDILSGKYPRGEMLTEQKLSAELGVSRTPIREALRRLAQEHIIKESTKGSIVEGISEDDVRDILNIRILLEGTAAAMTAANITDEQLAELKETLDLQEFYFERDNSENARIMDSKFHQLIYEFCGSMIYYHTMIPLHRKIQKYRKVTFENHGLGTVSIKEHHKIYEAIAAHDTEAAAEIMTEHVKNAKKRILGE